MAGQWYGAMPPEQPAQYGAPDPVDRPQPVVVAIRLLLVVAVLGIIGAVITLSEQDKIKRLIVQNSPSLDRAEVDAAARIGVITAVVVGIGFALFYVFLAYKMHLGRNWARVTTWVFTGLGILGTLISFAQAAPAASRVLTAVGGLLDVAIVVLLMQRSSNRFFRRSKRPVAPYGYGPPPGPYPPSPYQAPRG